MRGPRSRPRWVPRSSPSRAKLNAAAEVMLGHAQLEIHDAVENLPHELRLGVEIDHQVLHAHEHIGLFPERIAVAAGEEERAAGKAPGHLVDLAADPLVIRIGPGERAQVLHALERENPWKTHHPVQFLVPPRAPDIRPPRPDGQAMPAPGVALMIAAMIFQEEVRDPGHDPARADRSG